MLNAPKVSFGDNLKRLMTHRGINDVDLAEAVRVSHTAIGNYKRGRVPKAATLHRLAEFFGVPMDELLRGGASKASDSSLVPSPDREPAPTDTRPAGLQPAGLQPAGLQPAGLQPAGLQPAGLGARRPSRQRTLEELESDNLLQTSPDFQRIQHLREVGNLTWEQVSKELDLSVGMLMMVKTGKRKMSMKALYRLADAEKRAGIDSYENLSPLQLRQRPADTNTGTMADFLRPDELRRYIQKLEDDIKYTEEVIFVENEELSDLNARLATAKTALAEKLRRAGKFLSPDVASNNPPSSPEEMEEAISTALEDIALARQEAEDARAAAAEAKAEAENARAAAEAFERQLEEQLAKHQADQEELERALANKAELEAQFDAYVARQEAKDAGSSLVKSRAEQR